MTKTPQIPYEQRPHIAKSAHFESVFPHRLISNEWRVKWPISHQNGTTYNPDYWCPSLNCFIELATSLNNISCEWEKWKKAIAEGYQLRVFWWQGDEITERLDEARLLLKHRPKTCP